MVSIDQAIATDFAYGIAILRMDRQWLKDRENIAKLLPSGWLQPWAIAT